MLFGGYYTSYLLLIPAILLTLWAQFKVKSTFSKYARVSTRGGYTGAEAAQKMLNDNRISNVRIRHIAGNLSDNYNPVDKTLNLSEGVYASNSIAALGVACHEAGHALQHSKGYGPLWLRSAMYPISSFGSSLSWIIFIAGFIFQSKSLMDIGILLFGAAVLFTLITVPVEINASRRALAYLKTSRILTSDELPKAKKVLTAAALTYLAAALMAVLQLLRLLILRGDD